MRPRTLTIVLLLAFCASWAAAEDAASTRLRQEAVLWLDASDPDTASSLALGQDTWQDLSANQNDVQLFNAGYDPAFGGSVVFTAPSGPQEQGTYGLRTQVAGVRDGDWGQAFSAVAWYRGGEAGSQRNASAAAATLLQVLGAGGIRGPLRPSAYWQLYQFEDQDAQSDALFSQGFSARASYNATLPDCWQQLAVVKNDSRLQFYYDALPAGSAIAANVVDDYGAAALALGVDYATLVSLGNTSTDSQLPQNWLNGSLAVVMVFNSALSAGDIADLYDMDSPRFEEGLCSQSAVGPQPSPSAGPSPAPSPRPEPFPGLTSPAPAPSPELELSPELDSPTPAPFPEPELSPEFDSPTPAPFPEPELSPEFDSPTPAPSPEPELSPVFESPAPAPSPEPELSPEVESPAPAPSPEPEPSSELNSPSPSPALSPEPLPSSPPSPLFSPPLAEGVAAVTFAYAVSSSDLGAYTPTLEDEFRGNLAGAFSVASEQITLANTFAVNATIAGPLPADAPLAYADYLGLSPDQVEAVPFDTGLGTQQVHSVVVSVGSWADAVQALAALQDPAALSLAVGSGEARLLGSDILLYTFASVALTQGQLADMRYQLIESYATPFNLRFDLITAGMPAQTLVTMVQEARLEAGPSSPSPLPSSPTLNPSPSPSAASPSPAPALPSPSPSPLPSPSPSPLASPSPRPEPSPTKSPQPLGSPLASPSPPSFPRPSPSPSTLPPSAGLPGSPSPPPSPPSTLDVSTANVTKEGVTNHLAITGGNELLPFDEAKQAQLREAIAASLNLGPKYDASNVDLRVVNVTTEPKTAPGGSRKLKEEVLVEVNVIVVVEYTLKPTPEVPVPVLVKAEVEVKLFIRVQVDTMPWWNGTICSSDAAGQCTSQPVTPPVKVDGCTVDVCFLLDDSGSVVKVDAWNDIIAAARSIMQSISGRQSLFMVYRFSNFVEQIGQQTTRAEVATDSALIRTMLDTVPRARGTYTADAIKQCQSYLTGLQTGHPRTILLLTDGQPTDKFEALAAAQAAKAAGLRLVAVGAGDVDYETLSQMSSGADAVFASQELDTAKLLQLSDSAAQGVCQEE